MDKKFLAFLKGLVGLAQNTRLNLSLEGWPAVSAICAAGLLLIGVGATFAPTMVEGGQISDQGEPPEEDRQDSDDAPAEGSSDETDDPSN